jgi:hypothetical protein
MFSPPENTGAENKIVAECARVKAVSPTTDCYMCAPHPTTPCPPRAAAAAASPPPPPPAPPFQVHRVRLGAHVVHAGVGV